LAAACAARSRLEAGVACLPPEVSLPLGREPFRQVRVHAIILLWAYGNSQAPNFSKFTNTR